MYMYAGVSRGIDGSSVCLLSTGVTIVHFCDNWKVKTLARSDALHTPIFEHSCSVGPIQYVAYYTFEEKFANFDEFYNACMFI